MAKHKMHDVDPDDFDRYGPPAHHRHSSSYAPTESFATSTPAQYGNDYYDDYAGEYYADYQSDYHADYGGGYRGEHQGEYYASPASEMPTGAFSSTAAAPASTMAIDRDYGVLATDDPFYDVDDDLADPEFDEPAPNRGTMDFGLLLLRLCFGGYLIVASLTTFFRLGGSGGMNGLEVAFSAYPHAGALSIVVPTLQLTAGVFLLLGLITPVAAAVGIVVTSFMGLHAIAASGQGLHFFAWDQTVWLSLLLFGISLALQFTGPGLYGIDAGRTWARRPMESSWIWAAAGLAIGAVLWWFGASTNPFTATG